MKKLFLSKIKSLLEEQRAEILSKVSQNSNTEIDIDGDEADEIQGRIIALANNQLVARDKDRLFKIENALKKISNGTFGSCEECGEEIAEKRLFVNPGFITCISCAEKLEILKRKFHG